MSEFIKKPNLPTGDVTKVIIGQDASEAIQKLNNMGIETLVCPRNACLPEPVQSHADLQYLHLKENLILSCKEHLFTGESDENLKIIPIKGSLGNSYPCDVPLNCAIIGNKMICNANLIAPEILEFADTNSIRVIHVNQGYAKCSICIIDENSIITDDKSVFAAAQNFLNDVLFISKGSIRLKGYNYGFIGGCCGKIAKNKIAFNGRIESHADYKEIIDFLSAHNVEPVELYNNILTDIGGILPLAETML